MLKRLFSADTTKILLALLVILLIWWVSISSRGIQETNEDYSFSLAYGLIPLLWGILGFFYSKGWGGVKSSLGKSVLFLSAAVFAWGCGNLVYTYYNIILHNPIPYPSFADLGYVLLYPLAAIGVIYLFKATGAKFALREVPGKLSLFLIPLFLIILSFYLLFIVARGGVITYDSGLLKFILDIAYPIGDVVVITLSSIVYWLSYKYLGGYLKLPVSLILVGFIFNYIADFGFSYTTTVGTNFTGSWVDLVYTIGFSTICFGLSLLNPKLFLDRESQNNY